MCKAQTYNVRGQTPVMSSPSGPSVHSQGMQENHHHVPISCCGGNAHGTQHVQPARAKTAPVSAFLKYTVSLVPLQQHSWVMLGGGWGRGGLHSGLICAVFSHGQALMWLGTEKPAPISVSC